MEYLIIAALVAAAGGGVFISRKRKKSAKPAQPVPYRSFRGDEYMLYSVAHGDIRLLVPAITTECRFIAKYCARALQYYVRECGFEYANGVTIAVVPNGKTCGAGCGQVGAAGIEIMRPYWDTMLAEAKHGRAHQIPLYELGRNFWTLGGKCEFGGLLTAFAVYHRMVIADRLPMADQDGQPWAQFEARVRGLIDTYMEDPSLNYSNTFAVDKGIPGNLGGADLIASLLLRLDEQFNTAGVWAKAHKLPQTPNQVQAFIGLYPPAAQRWLRDVIGFPG